MPLAFLHPQRLLFPPINNQHQMSKWNLKLHRRVLFRLDCERTICLTAVFLLPSQNNCHSSYFIFNIWSQERKFPDCFPVLYFFLNLKEIQPSVSSYQLYKITFKLLLFEGGIIYNHFLSSSVTLNNKQNMQNFKNNARKRWKDLLRRYPAVKGYSQLETRPYILFALKSNTYWRDSME